MNFVDLLLFGNASATGGSATSIPQANTAFIDPVNGNDATASVGGLPFATAQAAYEAAWDYDSQTLLRFAPGVFQINPAGEWPWWIQVAGSGALLTTLTVTGADGTGGAMGGAGDYDNGISPGEGGNGTAAPSLYITDAGFWSLTLNVIGGTGGASGPGGNYSISASSDGSTDGLWYGPGNSGTPGKGGSLFLKNCYGTFVGGNGGYANGNAWIDPLGNILGSCSNGGIGGDVNVVHCKGDIYTGQGGGTYSDPGGKQPGHAGDFTTYNSTIGVAVYDYGYGSGNTNDLGWQTSGQPF